MKTIKSAARNRTKEYAFLLMLPRTILLSTKRPTPDPSQEGSRRTSAPCPFPSWEGLGVGSWSQCTAAKSWRLSKKEGEGRSGVKRTTDFRCGFLMIVGAAPQSFHGWGWHKYSIRAFKSPGGSDSKPVGMMESWEPSIDAISLR